ncbi:nose resistant to fluoxetine protein 6-like, partial [Tropilaelaps mercedesae]
GGQRAKMRRFSFLVALLYASMIIYTCDGGTSLFEAQIPEIEKLNATDLLTDKNYTEKVRSNVKVLDSRVLRQNSVAQQGLPESVSGDEVDTQSSSATSFENHENRESNMSGETVELHPGYFDEMSIESKTTIDLKSKLGSILDLLMEKVSGKKVTSEALDRMDANCTQALLRWVVGLRKMKPWALKMLDAMGRPPSGLASGTIADLGQFDQCLKTIAR